MRGFEFCRPVVVDGSHLSGAYKGTFVSAITLVGAGMSCCCIIIIFFKMIIITLFQHYVSSTLILCVDYVKVAYYH